MTHSNNYNLITTDFYRGRFTKDILVIPGIVSHFWETNSFDTFPNGYTNLMTETIMYHWNVYD